MAVVRVDWRPSTGGSTPSVAGSPASTSRALSRWNRAVTPSSLNREAMVPKTGSAASRARRRPVVPSPLPAHLPEGVVGPTPVELVDGHHVGQFQHVDLLELGGGTVLGGHHVEGDIGDVGDGGVALADAGRLHDDQVEAGRRRRPPRSAGTGRAARRWRPEWPGTGRRRSRRRWRSSGCGPRGVRRLRGAWWGRRPARRWRACPPGRDGTAGSARRSGRTCPSHRCR